MSKKARRIDTEKEKGPVQDKIGQTKDQRDQSFEHIIYLVIITVLFLSVYGYIFDKKIDFNGDNAYYYILGKALSQGEGYVNIADINKTPNNHYPPGYPFILSVFMYISDSVVFLKTINGIFLLASLFMFYYLFSHFSTSPKIAFITVFFLLLNSHFLLYSTILMSELSFILFSFLCLILILRTDFEKNLFKNPGMYLILATIISAYYIRSTGLALFGGLLLYLIIKKYWRAAIFIFTGFIVFAVPWIIRGQKLGGSSYIKPLVMINPYRAELGNAELTDYINRFFSNMSRYITREIPSGSLPFIQVNYLEDIHIQEWMIGLFILILIIFGLYKLGLKGMIIFTYLAATFGILLFWPEVWVGVRFVLPVIPLLLFAGILGFYYFVQFLLFKIGIHMKFNVLILLITGLAFFASIKNLHFKAKNDYPPAWQNYFNIAKWFKNEGLEDVVVICRKPMLFYLRSGTYTSNYAYANDTEALIEDLKRRKADYVVLDNLGYRQTYEYLLPAINSNKDKFQVVLKLENPDTYLLKFNPVD